jgi:PAS domain S-box-containing protein
MDVLTIARRQVEALQRQLDSLQSGAAEVVPDTALEQLQSSLEEMQVAEEELRVQHEELEHTAILLEGERQKYQQLFESAPDAYLVTDQLGAIREANQAACRLFGIPLRRVLGKPFSVFIPPDHRRPFRLELARRAAGEGTGEWELTVEPRTGPRVPIACTLVVGRVQETGERVLLWLVRDITERKEAEARKAELERQRSQREAAEATRAQLDAIIHHLPVPVFIAEGPSGRMATYNRAAEELFQYPIPLPDGVAEYSSVWRGFHPDGLEYRADEWPVARSLRGELVTGEEMEVIGLDGQRRLLRVSSTPVNDAEGKVVLAVSSVQDVTAEKRALETHRFLDEVSGILGTSLDYEETVQRIAELCTQVADFCAVYVRDDDGRVHGLGLAVADPAHESAARAALRSVPVDAGPTHPVLTVMRTGEPLLAETMSAELFEAIASDAAREVLMHDLALRSALLVPLSAAGRTLGVVALGRSARSLAFQAADLPLAEELALRAAHAVESARLYREARRAARVQEETISVVSHDLRNALNAALTNADLLLDITPAFEQGSRSRRQMEAVRRSLDHMHRLVQDLLEVDRLDRGGLSILPEPLAPQALVEELNGWLGPVARDAGLTCDIDIPDEIGAVLADHERVMQVLSNLIGNAVHATARGGRVVVSAENAEQEVHFHVTDSGRGIEPEDLPRIFDRFFQAPNGGSGGSGLGLTISRGIVEAHGGRIWAESTAGSGSTFSFSLPRAEPRR